MINAIEQKHYYTSIWGANGWERIANSGYYAELEDAKDDIDEFVRCFIGERYCVADERNNVLYQVGDQTSLSDLETHWLHHSRVTHQTLGQVALASARALEFGDRNEMLEAAELLRVLAYYHEVSKLRDDYFEAIEDSHRKEEDEMTAEVDVNDAPWWRFLRYTGVHGRLLKIRVKCAGLRVALAEKLIVDHKTIYKNLSQ